MSPSLNKIHTEIKIICSTAAALILIVHFVHLLPMDHNDFYLIIFSVIMISIISLLMILSDLKNRRKAEKELEESRSLLNLTFLESPDALFLADEDTHIIKKCSSNALKLFEFDTEEEIIGEFGPGFQKVGYTQEQMEEINRQINDKGFWQSELEFITNKGNTFWGAISVTAFNANGERFLLTRIMDETEKRRSRMELKELNASKDKFFSILAHDLRSPFSGITGITEVLAEDCNILSKEDIAEYSKAVNMAAKKVFGLLTNLLDWSRLQMGKMEFRPVRVNVTEIAEETAGLFAMNASSKNITLVNNIHKSLFCLADPNMLSTIFRNLISNAIKFTPSGGHVTLSARVYENICVIKVTDSGVGMNEMALGKLFRLDSNCSRRGTGGEEGSGLGLILCKELVEKNGGKITVQSSENKGTEFSFTLKHITEQAEYAGCRAER